MRPPPPGWRVVVLRRSADEGAGGEPGREGGDESGAGGQYQAAGHAPDSGTGVYGGAVEAEHYACVAGCCRDQTVLLRGREGPAAQAPCGEGG
jgi:hypothetical protein